MKCKQSTQSTSSGMSLSCDDSTCVCAHVCVCTNKAVVDSEEGHLTGLVEQVGESNKSVSCVQVQDQHCGNE